MKFRSACVAGESCRGGARSRNWLIALGCFVVLAGCASKITYLPAGTTYGEITVGKPRVSTRERLINDRLEEDAWLRLQLADTDNLQFGVQGATDIRAFSGTFAKAGISADSSAVALYRDKQQQALADGRRQDALKDLEHQIALARKQKELADALAGTATTSTNTSGAPQTAASSPSGSNTPPKPSLEIQNQLESLNTALATLGQRISSLTGRGTETMPVPTSATASPIDLFRDRLAYREEVRSEMIRNALDDAHDLGTNTLYRLSFDATVFPGDDTSAWAVVGVELELPKPGVALSAVSPKSIEDALSPGHIRLDRFLRIVNARVAEEAAEFTQQVLRECRGAPSSRCLSELRPETLLKLNEHAKVATSTAGSSDKPVGARASYSDVLKQLPSFATDSVNRAGPAYRAIAPRSSTQFLSQEQLDALWKNLTELGEAPANTPSFEHAVAGTYVAVLRSLNKQLADGSDAEQTSAGCYLNRKKRLHGFSTPYPHNQIEIQAEHRDLAVITMLREQSGPETYAANERWSSEEISCNVNGYLSAARKIVLDEMELNRLGTVSAYAATPKETVQRVSEVLSRRNASEFALALQAVTGAASVEAMFSHIRANDALFHALRRQPLIVGFSGSFAPDVTAKPARFGWMFGPRYEIRYAGQHSAVPVLSGFWDSTSQAAGFRHVIVQNNVSAVVSVPAAYEHVSLRLNRCWRKSETQWVSGNTAGPCNAEAGAIGAGADALITVHLPLDERRVFRLEDRKFASEREATVAADSPWKYEVRVDEPATLVVRGEHLWRNTKVLLGAQEADAVQVLPDMRGILATFRKVWPSTSSGLRGEDMDLKIVTSDKTVVAGRVTVREPRDAAAGPAWTIKGPRAIVGGGTFRVTADGRLPAAYASIDLRIANQTLREMAPVEVSDRTVDEAERLVAFSPPADKFAKWRSGDSARAEISLKRHPNDPTPQTRVFDSLVVYKTESDAQAKYTTTQPGDNSRKFVISMPPKFRTAYPVMFSQNSVNVRYEWKNAEGKTESAQGSCDLSGQKEKCEVTLGVNKTADGTLVIGRGADEGYPLARKDTGS